MPADRPVSSLVLAELYESGDAAFLELMLSHRGSFKPLLGILERWKKDQRPWARRLKFEYVASETLPWQSRVVFKRLFKQAWAERDHELLGAFMHVLDKSIRRKRARRYRFTPGLVETVEVLRVPAYSSRSTFSLATRHYLRRRVWRYFRRLGHADGQAYRRAMVTTLPRYTDDDVRAGENLLDNWGLMHACFGKSPQLAFNARHTNLAPAGTLSELAAAPMFERHWAATEGFPALNAILLNARCRPVRTWAIQLLRRLHAEALPKIDAQSLLKLLDHADADVAGFAAELLANAQTVSAFPMATWMDLLATRNPMVVATIAEAFRKHVAFDRVSLPQAVELATRVAVPVATLGLDILESRTIRSADVHQLAALSAARCEAVGERVARFAITRLNVAGVYRLDEIIAFFDSRLRTLRDGSFAALAAESPADTDPAFWARLFESPYDDVRIELIQRLKQRETLPGASAESLGTLWQSVLLNIHRGGRAKLSALRQISDRIVHEPQHAATLLPILAIALRSVREPEARHGLAAIVTAVDRVPALADDVQRFLPELQLNAAGAAR